MEKLVVYHNPGCSKSRGAVEILTDRGVDFDTVQYLKEPPDRATLEFIVSAIDSEPKDLVRKDKHFKELGLDASQYETADAVVDLLLEHPRLMERPVIVLGERALIGRPPERVEELLD